jgi:bis(5'-nucleosyl)-tetraphosphatase (symmetrical)
MAIYLVGDIQGCFDELTSLLANVNFAKDVDTLYVAGDLVARGPKSLETLRFIKSLGTSAKIVLGNHDLHLLAVYEGIKKPKPCDLLSSLLEADDINELIDWLASQPLIQAIPNLQSPKANIKVPFAYMSHAGLSPQWQLTDALEQATMIQSKLSSDERKWWLSKMYGEQPNSWHLAKTDVDKFRFSINALTRMRYCFADGSLEFQQKSSPNQNKITNLYPWYMLSKAINAVPWVFGHWASLMGKCSHSNIYPLDTGCVWGNELTLLRWHDKKYFTVKHLN